MRFGVPAPPEASVPQTIAPSPLVSNESQFGRFVRNASAKTPPVNVDVPAPTVRNPPDVRFPVIWAVLDPFNTPVKFAPAREDSPVTPNVLERVVAPETNSVEPNVPAPVACRVLEAFTTPEAFTPASVERPEIVSAPPPVIAPVE